MYEFDYTRPASLNDAASGLSDADAKLVAGGMTLIPTLKMRLAKPSPLIDLGAMPALSGRIGAPPVRNRGTIGGSIANNDPAADYPAAVVALNAVVRTNKREIPADSFFTGLFET